MRYSSNDQDTFKIHFERSKAINQDLIKSSERQSSRMPFTRTEDLN